MQRPNIAVRLRNALMGAVAVPALAAAAAAQKLNEPQGTKAQFITKRTNRRWGRSVQVHQARKEEFNKHMDDTMFRPKHTSVARKASVGTLTLPGGRRGLQTRMVGSVLTITR
ncbi:hypothetical protein AB7813_08295 [Tardiphaga sp. 20_F10_N6_6]|uniref:hypothetical protein n=1 Tax=Tardiphaga sp. 20_F10_N6_6 TaxID=3240788 RepID=UPI003F8BEDB7